MPACCYACDQLATSRDHAPPLCIFPADADSPDGKSRRNNLITVPACDKHNLKKSKDDEYLMMVLAAPAQNNLVARSQILAKVVRAWNRRPHLATMAVRNPRPARLDGQDSMIFQVDASRFDRSMELIARALIFHEGGSRWHGECQVWSPSMLPSKPETASEVMVTSHNLLAALPVIFEGADSRGTNPDVFQYRLRLPIDQENVGMVDLLFYEGFRVCVLLRAEA